jgi:F-type H+-transporting ATPase subunit gamma
MGASTKELRQRITSVSNIQKITRAMEMVAATKLRRLQQRAEGTRPYADAIAQLSANLAASAPPGSSPLTRTPQDVDRAAVLVVSSDRGLCGSYNTNVFRAVSQHMNDTQGVEPALYVLGRKGLAHYASRLQVHAAYDDVVEKLSSRRARGIARELSDAFLAGSKQGGVDEVYVAFTRFVSMGRQVACVEKLLPIEQVNSEEEGAGGAAAAATGDVILEPSPRILLQRLLPKSIEVRVFASILEALASEFAARRAAMKAATDAAGDMITSLRRQYNRARQEAITTELLDIVGGAEALQ